MVFSFTVSTRTCIEIRTHVFQFESFTSAIHTALMISSDINIAFFQEHASSRSRVGDGRKESSRRCRLHQTTSSQRRLASHPRAHPEHRWAKPTWSESTRTERSCAESESIRVESESTRAESESGSVQWAESSVSSTRLVFQSARTDFYPSGNLLYLFVHIFL